MGCAGTLITGRRGPDSRQSVNGTFERAEEKAALDYSGRAEIQQLLTFVLVGAGTVGVEMAGTLAILSSAEGKVPFFRF
jgi:NADH dehydrogenase FAD-containing subunit